MENRVKFKIGDIEFEAEGSAEVIERERNVFMNALLPAAVDAIVRTRGVEGSTQYIENHEMPLIEQIDSPMKTDDNPNAINISSQDYSRTSLPAFINQFGNVNDQDFTLVSVYYYEKKNNETVSFSSETIKQYYAEARRKPYSNYSGLLAELVKKGYIMDDPNAEKKTPKFYIMTNSGINYVETYRPKERSDKTRVVKTRKTKVESVYSSINVDELNIKKYPDIKKLKHFKEQMLMIMFIISNEQKGETFSVIDLQYLMTDVWGLPASKDQINGVFKANKSWFKKEEDSNNKKAYKRKLLQGAKDFIAQIIESNPVS